jgi:hypothetical protein
MILLTAAGAPLAHQSMSMLGPLIAPLAIVLVCALFKFKIFKIPESKRIEKITTIRIGDDIPPQTPEQTKDIFQKPTEHFGSN